MATYVRFVCPRYEAGIFQAAADLVRGDELSAADRAALVELLDWFGTHLAAPDRLVATKSKGWYRRDSIALSWFKVDALECIRRVWKVARLAQANGVAVELIRTSTPGYITYEDEYQVAAVPFSDR